MKKILSFIVLFVLLAGLTVPILVYGQPQELPTGCKITNPSAISGECAGHEDFCDFTEIEECGMCCLVNTIYNITNWLFYLMVVAVVVLFVAAGAWFMLAGGDVEKTKKAKGLMILGAIGLIIALLAKLIPSVVKLIVGM